MISENVFFLVGSGFLYQLISSFQGVHIQFFPPKDPGYHTFYVNACYSVFFPGQGGCLSKPSASLGPLFTIFTPQKKPVPFFKTSTSYFLWLLCMVPQSPRRQPAVVSTVRRSPRQPRPGLTPPNAGTPVHLEDGHIPALGGGSCPSVLGHEIRPFFFLSLF